MYQLQNNETSLIKTLLYSSLFHFPLTVDEIWRYFISERKISKNEFDNLLKMKHNLIEERESYYFLKGQENFVAKRQDQQEQYAQKMRIAQRACLLLAYIPSILFIGVSGSLAVGSTPKDADIDFFIVTKPRTVWITRFLAVTFLTVVNLRRKRGVKKAQNKVCLNSFVGLTMVDYFASSKDIYTAHELAQLYPLLNRNRTYEFLLSENKWYLNHLPNAVPRVNEYITKHSSQWFDMILRFLNPLCASLQMLYMKKHKTTEIVKKELIMLHPRDYKVEILKKYEAKLMEYDLLTKK